MHFKIRSKINGEKVVRRVVEFIERNELPFDLRITMLVNGYKLVIEPDAYALREIEPDQLKPDSLDESLLSMANFISSLGDS